MRTLSITRNLVAAPLVAGALVGSLTVSQPASASPGDPKSSFRLAERVQITAAPTASLPVSDYRLTGTFGASSGLWSSTHTGLDFAAPYGSEIRAVQGGEVVETYYDGSYGNKTVVRGDDGTEWWYCHQDSFLVGVGERVEAGQAIGAVGNTGNSTGPHLHLEVRPYGDSPVDPYAALTELGLQL